MADTVDAVAQAISEACGCRWDPKNDPEMYMYYRRAATRALNTFASARGIVEERRVMTPQGTSRVLRPDEGDLGDRLRGLGWWIESRLVSGWVRKDNTNE